MKRIVLLLIAVVFASCKQEKTETAAGDQPFFIFDKVVHYHKEISRQYLDTLYDKPEKSRNDLGLIQIVTGNVPVNPADTLFVKNMSILEFSQHEIEASKNAEISKLFSQKTPKETVAESANCKAIYADVLVFRGKGKIVGVAKIDFNCKKAQIVGMRYSPENFGKSGEFDELQKLVGSK
ncbi:hypothetical protein [Flavobacterium sp.]|uniref:hypothetical protein n=1 Tax=Flavobacterium sp. TaxID=239 RepID=UPI00121E5B3B|nr:hypothetical protein [Flavobacterium sp.]RZJ73246.1 MAG: hypothetical protein EOO49_02765 [Flavobacterium sp.]